jgi:Maf-like protein
MPTSEGDPRTKALEERFCTFVSTDPQPQIILGTQSQSRRAVIDRLAKQFDFKYSSITADIDEQAIRRDDPQELVLVLAHAKADAIVKKLQASSSLLKPGFLVTCDQVWQSSEQASCAVAMASATGRKLHIRSANMCTLHSRHLHGEGLGAAAGCDAHLLYRWWCTMAGYERSLLLRRRRAPSLHPMLMAPPPPLAPASVCAWTLAYRTSMWRSIRHT